MEKICNMCQKVHKEIPKNARPQNNMTDLFDSAVIGYYWECQCGSTMFHLLAAARMQMKKVIKAAV